MQPATESVTYQRFGPLGGVELIAARDVRHVMPRQSAPHYKIALVERGRRVFYYRGGEHQTGAGEVIVIHPGEVNGSRPSGPPAEVRVLCVDPDVVSEALGAAGPLPMLFPFLLSRSPAGAGLSRLFSMMGTPNDGLRQHALILDLLGSLFAQQGGPSLRSPGTESGPVGRVRALLEDRYADNVSLMEMASVAGLAPAYLCRVFRDQVGVPPHAYLMGVRVARAKPLLTQGRTAGETAALSGFYDQAHFTHAFARYARTTPARYARSVRR